jgi:cyclase
MVQRTGVPAAPTRGGPETIYPEYQARLKKDPARAVSTAEAPRVSQAKNPDTGQLEVLRVQGNVHLLAGGGANVAVQVGPSGTIMVDAKSGAMTDRMLAAVTQLSSSGKPVRYILNTSADADHAGGNESFTKVLGSAYNWAIINTPGGSQTAVKIVAHDNVLARMSSRPTTSWPTETFVGREKEIFFNGEPVLMYHVPSAHTDGDSIVFFRRSDVVSTGDIFQTTTYPFIDVQRGGSIDGIIDAMNNILDLTVPREKQEGGTYVIPGHGRLCDEHDVLEYRDMLTIIRDRIQDAAKKGMTLEQVRAMKPTLDYDARWGASEGWTTDMFIETIYAEVKSKK